MLIALHKNARTTPAVRAEIAASSEAASVLAQRFGITEQTVYKWKKREVFGGPKVGCSISMDEHPGSQRIPLTLNKYLYGNADPVNHIDPSGNFGLGSVGSALSGMANMAAISYARKMVFDMLSNALLSPIVDAAVKIFMSDGKTPRVAYGNAGISQLLTGLAVQCRVTSKCCSEKFLSWSMAGRVRRQHVIYGIHCRAMGVPWMMSLIRCHSF